MELRKLNNERWIVNITWWIYIQLLSAWEQEQWFSLLLCFDKSLRRSPALESHSNFKRFYAVTCTTVRNCLSLFSYQWLNQNGNIDLWQSNELGSFHTQTFRFGRLRSVSRIQRTEASLQPCLLSVGPEREVISASWNAGNQKIEPTITNRINYEH